MYLKHYTLTLHLHGHCQGDYYKQEQNFLQTSISVQTNSLKPWTAKMYYTSNIIKYRSRPGQLGRGLNTMGRKNIK